MENLMTLTEDEAGDSRDVAEGKRFFRGLRFALLAVIPFWGIVAYLVYLKYW